MCFTVVNTTSNIFLDIFYPDFWVHDWPFWPIYTNYVIKSLIEAILSISYMFHVLHCNISNAFPFSHTYLILQQAAKEELSMSFHPYAISFKTRFLPFIQALLYFQAAAYVPLHTTHIDLNPLLYECAAVLGLITAFLAGDSPCPHRLGKSSCHRHTRAQQVSFNPTPCPELQLCQHTGLTLYICWDIQYLKQAGILQQF